MLENLGSRGVRLVKHAPFCPVYIELIHASMMTTRGPPGHFGIGECEQKLGTGKNKTKIMVKIITRR